MRPVSAKMIVIRAMLTKLPWQQVVANNNWFVRFGMNVNAVESDRKPSLTVEACDMRKQVQLFCEGPGDGRLLGKLSHHVFSNHDNGILVLTLQ